MSVAFFDVDETLITVKSMFAFLRHWLAERGDDGGEYARITDEIKQLAAAGTPREEINRHYYRLYRGVEYAALEESGKRWFDAFAADGAPFYLDTLEALRAHRDSGVRTVLLSGSFAPAIAPVAAAAAAPTGCRDCRLAQTPRPRRRRERHRTLRRSKSGVRMVKRLYDLTPTTQGPLYPPSEIVDADGNFLVVGFLNEAEPDGTVTRRWGRAVVAADTPLSAHNYPMVFAPDQLPNAGEVVRRSYPFHEVPIPDLRPEDGRKLTEPVTLGRWLEARGTVEVAIGDDEHHAEFHFERSGLIPDSLYTIMSLRSGDLNPAAPTRPGPLGVPNVFITGADGTATYRATLPNPFPDPATPGANRVISVIVLWQSYQQNCSGAIGHFGLGGDIHAQLKLPTPTFEEFRTRP